MDPTDRDMLGQERTLYINLRSKDDREQRETIEEWRRAHSAHGQDGMILSQDGCIIPDTKVEPLMNFRMRTTEIYKMIADMSVEERAHTREGTCCISCLHELQGATHVHEF